MKRANIYGIVLVILVAAGTVAWNELRPTQQPNKPSTTPAAPPANPPDPVKAGLDKRLYSISEADSIWVIVNKQRALADGYIPTDLVVPKVTLRLGADSEQMKVRAATARAMESLFAAASKQNLSLMLASGYRSQSYQKTLYQGYVAKDGQSAADRSSARPSHSEHQTGFAFDVEPADKRCELDICFGDTLEGKWLAANAHDYGFIIRYGKDQEQLTGYQYEPWHLRYVGKDLATELVTKNLTMEQFFGLSPALTY